MDPTLALKTETRRLPGRLQAVLRRLEQAQRTGGKRAGATPDLRRVEDGDVVYLPEIGRGRTPMRLLTMLLVPLSGVGLLVGGLVWVLVEARLGLAVAGAGLGCFVLAVALTVLDGVLASRRRRGIERYGLVVVPGALLLWGPRYCRIAPRESIVRFAAERRGRYVETADVRTADGQERWVLHPRESAVLRRALGRWRADEAPWFRDDDVGGPLIGAGGRRPGGR